jgi:hypothetical protein
MGTLTMQDIRNATYKLLNEYQTITANVDTNIVNRVDEQINLCYMELATKDKISASFWIAQFPIPNLLYPSSNNNNTTWADTPYDGSMYITDSYDQSALTYAAASAASYYYEVDGSCTLDIYEISAGGTATLQSFNTGTGVSTFTQYTGFITAVSGADTIQLSFYTTGATFDVRNVALYKYTFNGVTASIPTYTPYVEYSIPSAYYSINRVRYKYYDDYRNFSDYRIDNDIDNQRKLLIPRGYRGEFVFDYWRLPSAVTTATNTFDIRDSYAYIIPWGVAGAIMLGNGFNARVGQLYIQIYEGKKNGIKLDHNYGRMGLDNIKGW